MQSAGPAGGDQQKQEVHQSHMLSYIGTYLNINTSCRHTHHRAFVVHCNDDLKELHSIRSNILCIARLLLAVVAATFASAIWVGMMGPRGVRLKNRAEVPVAAGGNLSILEHLVDASVISQLTA
jgi:hypothetical protein